MNKIKHLYLIGILSLFAYLPLFAQNASCEHPDYPALVALYNATDGDNWTEQWDLSNCDVCAWDGIGCDPLTNRVDVISLNNNNLIGELPPEIGDINFLIVLDLSNNQLSGSIPSEIEKIQPVPGFIFGLRSLSLDNNQLSGPIPEAIGKLSGGESLNLSNNNLSGPIPNNLADFGNASNLIRLNINVDNNNLSGCFPSNLDKFCPGDAFVSFSALGNTDLPNGGDFAPFCELGEGLCNSEPMGCAALQFIGAIEQITVSGLTVSSKVEIIGSNTNYQTIIICEADCSETLDIPDLVEGAYTVKVNLFDGENYCYQEEIVMVEGDGGNTGNGNADCNNLIFLGQEGQISIEGLTASTNKVEIIGHNTDWQVITICDGDCSSTQIIPDLEAGEYAVKINQSGSDGSYCYREEQVVVSNEGNTGGSANCDGLAFSSSNDTIIIYGLTASYDKVEILGRNTNWQVVTICGGDCSDTQLIPDLQDGAYSVKVNQGGNDGSYCYREEKVTIENGSNNRNTKLDFGNDLVLFPNPARDRIYLRFPAIVGQKGSIQIHNVYGQMVQSSPEINFDNENISLDLNGYENGMYIITIQLKDLQKISRRFLVEHLQ